MTIASASHHAGAAELSRRHPVLIRLGQAGWFMKGIVYVLAGALAVIVLARSSGSPLVRGPSEEASRPRSASGDIGS